jgi:hypothetical protein
MRGFLATAGVVVVVLVNGLVAGQVVRTVEHLRV